MRFFRHILLQVSCAILLLHNFTPHMHHDEMSEEQHVLEHTGAQSLLDWFRLAFHSDIGEGHLEHFVFADADFADVEFIDALSELPVVCSTFSFEQSIIESEVVVKEHSPPDILHPLPKPFSNIQRGPPAHLS